ncbi:MAG: hypothetical protein CUN54_07250 [Phototrophicales bacterium]|nr:MAG: hypothetical protein CUN54_07250 [Phototrophicales bacterium]
MTTALILAGHGSHISPNTAGLVWQYVDILRSWGVADEITACFWKEAPFFSCVLDTVEADEIVIVPMFTAQGYFTQTVIPAEMCLDGAVTHRDGRTIRYSQTLGDHPYLAQVVRQRVEDVLATKRLDPDEVAVAVIGHGTLRNRNSRDATRQQADELRKINFVAEVVDVYLDDVPFISDVYQLTQSAYLIAVPFFLAPGSHVTEDVPRALGLQVGQSSAAIQGRCVYYTPPVGTDESIVELILELAGRTGLPFARTKSNSWNCFPKVGCDEFIETVAQTGELIFGQLRLSLEQVCPADVVEAHLQRIDTPAQLRTHLRDNPFRPLATSDDLPHDWFVPITAPAMLHGIVETVYPGAVADWAANHQRQFVSVPLEETLSRQVGMFQTLSRLNEKQIQHNIDKICDRCVRHPTWHFGETSLEQIPCKEACNFWMSAAKEQLNDG